MSVRVVKAERSYVSANELVQRLRSMESLKNREGMARFGIKTDNALGISIDVLRDIAKDIGKDHTLALTLWDTGIHEAQMIAGMIDDPMQVTEAQLDRWVADFDSWDLCDQSCSNLFDKTPFARAKVFEWADDDREFVRRSCFVMMACLSVHDLTMTDEDFEPFFPVIKKYATDDRNFVRKAVNWALRQIGKRNLRLNERAVAVAREVQAIDSKSARWIAADALRELESDKVRQRIAAKESRQKAKRSSMKK
jgi:3-methyladenine DNA glycosylase AlkD